MTCKRIAEAAAGIDFSSVTEVLDEYVAFTDEYFAQVDELKQIAIDVVEQIDVKLIRISYT